jgi:uncharacterized protein
MDTKESIIQFPCYFPIKIIGKYTPGFQAEVTQIVITHFPRDPKPDITCQNSKNGNFISITATVYVHTQTELDSLYQELSQHPEMKMVL